MIDMDEKFYLKLKDILPFYEKVRAAIITLESLDEEQKMYLAPINEMRNALDHLFKAVKSYEIDTIVAVLPEYYTKIKPKLTELKRNTAKKRIERNMGCDKYFSSYMDNIEQIMEINNMIDVHIEAKKNQTLIW